MIVYRGWRLKIEVEPDIGLKFRTNTVRIDKV